VLTLKTLGVDNVMSFDLLSAPSVNAMAFSLEELHALGAIDEKGKLVPGVGDLMGEFPVEVKFAKVRACVRAQKGASGSGAPVLYISRVLSRLARKAPHDQCGSNGTRFAFIGRDLASPDEFLARLCV
jgi:HrpA-like RNA helicase